VTKAKSCAMCGKATTKFLFNDEMLGISICSGKCEYEYLDSLAPNTRQQMNMLRSLDDKIETTKKHERAGWAIAALGLLIIAIGFLVLSTLLFLLGVLPLTLGALSTRHFEYERNKLMKIRKRIFI